MIFFLQKVVKLTNNKEIIVPILGLLSDKHKELRGLAEEIL